MAVGNDHPVAECGLLLGPDKRRRGRSSPNPRQTALQISLRIQIQDIESQSSQEEVKQVRADWPEAAQHIVHVGLRNTQKLSKAPLGKIAISHEGLDVQ